MSVTIRIATQADLIPALEDLTDILLTCVHAGASVGFILPFRRDEARAFWQDRIFPAVRGGASTLFLARDGARVVGTVQLGLALPPNQPHRADVSKMLVHPNVRRRGIARALMRALDAQARALGKTLLVLDTRSNDHAQPLYESEGFRVAGEIPGYCRNPFSDSYEGTVYMYKALT